MLLWSLRPGSGTADGWIRKKAIRSDALTVTERYGRTTFGRLQAEITIDDPKAYLGPWTVHVDFVLQPDTDLLESACESHINTMVHRTISRPPPKPPSSPMPLDLNRGFHA